MRTADFLQRQSQHHLTRRHKLGSLPRPAGEIRAEKGSIGHRGGFTWAGSAPRRLPPTYATMMKTAGLTVPIFSESATQRVYGASQGIPRIINQICAQALYDATHRGHEVIEEVHNHFPHIDI